MNFKSSQSQTGKKMARSASDSMHYLLLLYCGARGEEICSTSCTRSPLPNACSTQVLRFSSRNWSTRGRGFPGERGQLSSVHTIASQPSRCLDIVLYVHVRHYSPAWALPRIISELMREEAARTQGSSCRGELRTHAKRMNYRPAGSRACVLRSPPPGPPCWENCTTYGDGEPPPQR